MTRVALHIVLILTVLAVGCDGDDDGAASRDHGDLLVAWPEQTDPEYVEARAALMGSAFEGVAAAFNHGFALPRDLTLRHESCGEINAFYRGSDSSIRMCYEMLERIGEVFEGRTDLGDHDPAELAAGTWFFVLFHELGHALIDLYDLPVLGMQEDAADEFATWMLVDLGAVDLALSGAAYWAATDSETYTTLQYTDSHGLNPQRVATILCHIYGSDPETYADVAPLFEFRDCEYEYYDKSSTWEELLADWRF